MLEGNPKQDSNVLYSAPSSETLKNFVRQVCYSLEAESVTPQNVEGLASFIRIVAIMHTKCINSQIQSHRGLDNEG